MRDAAWFARNDRFVRFSWMVAKIVEKRENVLNSEGEIFRDLNRAKLRN